MPSRIRVVAATIALVLAAAVPAAGVATAAPPASPERWAADTWRSFVALVEPRTGLPHDNISGDLRPGSRSGYTSPTNTAMYLWATLGARDIGLIGATEAQERMAKTLTTLEGLERHEPSGQFYNWYDPASGAKLTEFPSGDRVNPFLSSVDNGWLAAALLMVANGEPALHDRASALAASMDFGCYYDPNAKGPDAGAGLIRGGFWRQGDEPSGSGGFPRDDYCGMGETVVYTGHHYGAFNTEPRIASYVGIALGQIPPEHYFAGWRTFPDACDWSWPETRPVGEWRTYLGVDVFEGAYRIGDTLLVPTWGGSMFEALMPALVVPELDWGTGSWAVTHPLYVDAQISYGLDEAGYGAWGFSPSSDPEVANGYREYGVDAIGMEPNGYTSDVERGTLVDAGWDDPACPRPAKPIAAYGQGVVTPHAAFLALELAPDEALDNLRHLASTYPALYGKGGFKDAVNVSSGRVADRYLALDQGMVMAALANRLTGDRLRGYLASTLEPSLRPLMEMEEFGAGRMGS
jgi:hypothetical protein